MAQQLAPGRPLAQKRQAYKPGPLRRKRCRPGPDGGSPEGISVDSNALQEGVRPTEGCGDRTEPQGEPEPVVSKENGACRTDQEQEITSRTIPTRAQPVLRRGSAPLPETMREVPDTEGPSSEPELRTSALEYHIDVQRREVSVDAIVETGGALMDVESDESKAEQHDLSSPEVKEELAADEETTPQISGDENKGHVDDGAQVASSCEKDQTSPMIGVEPEQESPKLTGRPCLICDERFPSTALFREHMLQRHLHVKPYTCMVCWKSFFTGEEINRHTTFNCLVTYYKCQRCDLVWSSEEGDPKTCVACSKNPKNLKTVDTPYECAVCGLSYKLLRNLTSHVKTHSGEPLEALERPFKCNRCSKRYNMGIRLMVHIKQHADVSPNKHRGDQANKSAPMSPRKLTKPALDEVQSPDGAGPADHAAPPLVTADLEDEKPSLKIEGDVIEGNGDPSGASPVRDGEQLVSQITGSTIAAVRHPSANDTKVGDACQSPTGLSDCSSSQQGFAGFRSDSQSPDGKVEENFASELSPPEYRVTPSERKYLNPAYLCTSSGTLKKPTTAHTVPPCERNIISNISCPENTAPSVTIKPDYNKEATEYNYEGAENIIFDKRDNHAIQSDWTSNSATLLQGLEELCKGINPIPVVNQMDDCAVRGNNTNDDEDLDVCDDGSDTFVEVESEDSSGTTDPPKNCVPETIPVVRTSPEGLPSTKKMYPCKICEKKFAYQASLALHSRVHSEERPFACGVCAKDFKLRGHVTRHLKRHFLNNAVVPDTCWEDVKFGERGVKQVLHVSARNVRTQVVTPLGARRQPIVTSQASMLPKFNSKLRSKLASVKKTITSPKVPSLRSAHIKQKPVSNSANVLYRPR